MPRMHDAPHLLACLAVMGTMVARSAAVRSEQRDGAVGGDGIEACQDVAVVALTAEQGMQGEADALTHRSCGRS